MELKKASQSALIRLARNALYRHFGLPAAKKVDLTQYPEITEKAGLFVSLYLYGELHGCVGHLARDIPMATVVRKMSIAAATSDPRFHPLAAEDIPHVTLEISVLSPFQLTTDFSTIKVGKHGLFIEVGGRHGLLLPQVGERYNWSPDQFLQETCTKAGLPPDAYLSSDAKISMFTATVIKE